MDSNKENSLLSSTGKTLATAVCKSGLPDTRPERQAVAGIPKSILESCNRRVRSWRIPPHWSRRDWLEEIEAITAVAAWQARFRFEATKGVLYEAFMYQSVMAAALTRYRQEWGYALHVTSHDNPATPRHANHEAHESSDSPEIAAGFSSHRCVHFSHPLIHYLQEALMKLSSAQQQLISNLIYGYTEAEIAKELGISQRAVSKRKQVTFRMLRDLLSR